MKKKFVPILLATFALASCAGTSSESSTTSVSEELSSAAQSSEETSSEVISEVSSESSAESSSQASSEEVSSEASSEATSEASSESSSEESSEVSSESSEESSESSLSSVTPDTFPIWKRVTASASLNDGDYIVLADLDSHTVAGGLNNTYLSTHESTFTTDNGYITDLSEDAAVFLVSVVGDDTYILENANGPLCAYKNSGKYSRPTLSYEKGEECWVITFDAKGNVTIVSANADYGSLQADGTNNRFKMSTKSASSFAIYKGLPPVYPTAISIEGETSVAKGKRIKLEAAFEPADANVVDVTWSSSDESILTVSSSGKVRGIEEGSATIFASVLNEEGEKLTTETTITVTPEEPDDYTILLYICGSNLESYDSYYHEYGSQASANLYEIMQVEDMPDSVNILVETGGANSWDPSYATYLGASIEPELTRWTVQDQQLVAEEESLQPKDASMGKASTFQSFLEWGIENYPAEKTGVVVWNHGGAMTGSCADERYGDDMLTPSELASATEKAFENTETEKLEWIGYDCCLMAVQDIADLNSQFFNYQISSQETEPGPGWDYDGWLPAIAENPSVDTQTLGEAICDSYYEKTGAMYEEYASYGYTEYKDYNDATISLLDLTKAEEYRLAFEGVAAQLADIITTSTQWKALKKVANSCERYGYYGQEYSYYNGGYPYDVFNVSEFFPALTASETFASVDVAEAEAALEEFIAYNRNGPDHPNSCGLCFFCPLSGASSTSDYSESQTHYSVWRSLVLKFGSWY